MCLSYVAIRQEKGFITVPCGKCVQCLQKKRAEWSFRLLAELKCASSAYFVTLTYDDENLQSIHLQKDDLQKFLKRLRKKQSMKSNDKIKYYAVGEYGEKTERPHWHLIMFNVLHSLIYDLKSTWKLGHIHVGEVTQASIHYCTKYILNKVFEWKELEPPKAYMSKGLGDSYIDNKTAMHHVNNMDDTVSFDSGHVITLPRNLRNKIFSEPRREKLNKTKMKCVDEKELALIRKAERKQKDYFKIQKETHFYKSIEAMRQAKSTKC